MVTRQLAAQIPDREIAIAAYTLGMTDATKAEIVKVAILVQAGRTHEDAKTEVLALRKPIKLTDRNDVFNVKVPDEWFKAARRRHPNLSLSELFRYSIVFIAEPDHDAALKRATRKRGRPPKAKAQEVAA